MTSYQVPVIVTYTQKHVVWVDAPDLADGQPMAAALQQARDRLAGWPYESTNSDNLAESGTSVTVPDHFDYQWTIYDDTTEPGGGRDHDAHVETHRHELWKRERDAKRAACAEAGHPDAPLSDGRRWCRGCSQYLQADALAGVTKGE